MNSIGRPPSSRFFFVHIMKTAGTNFLTQFRQVFPTGSVWPVNRPRADSMSEDWTTISNYMSLAPLARLSEVELRALSLVAGHVPFSAAELLDDGGPRLSCITLLRSPVERTVSFLDQCRRHRPELHETTLEGIYDDPWYFDRFVRDHQTRVFSMTLAEATAPRSDQVLFADFLKSMIPASASPDDRARVEGMIRDDQEVPDASTADVVVELEGLGVDMANHKPAYEAFEAQPRYWVPEGGMGYLYADAALTRPSPVNASRLARAVDNLERCVVVGLTEDYPGFIDDLNRTCEVACSAEGWLNVGNRGERSVPKSFVRRIETENRYDMEFYEAARQLVATRRRPNT